MAMRPEDISTVLALKELAGDNWLIKPDNEDSLTPIQELAISCLEEIDLGNYGCAEALATMMNDAAERLCLEEIAELQQRFQRTEESDVQHAAPAQSESGRFKRAINWVFGGPSSRVSH